MLMKSTRSRHGLAVRARGVDAAAVGIQQQRRPHGGIERRLAPLAAIGPSDLGEIEIVPPQAQHRQAPSSTNFFEHAAALSAAQASAPLHHRKARGADEELSSR